MGEGDGVVGEDDRVVGVDHRHTILPQQHSGTIGREGERAPLLLLLGNVVISKKILRTRKIMVMNSNERGECVHVPS